MLMLATWSQAAVLIIAISCLGFGQEADTVTLNPAAEAEPIETGGLRCFHLPDISTRQLTLAKSKRIDNTQLLPLKAGLFLVTKAPRPNLKLELSPLSLTVNQRVRMDQARCPHFMAGRSSAARPDRVQASDGDQFIMHVSADPAGPNTQAQSSDDAQELAKKLSNPVASLISVPFQGNFDFGMGAGSGWKFTLNFQPVIPVALSPEWNMISRTIVPIVHQSDVAAPGTSQSGLGDVLQSLFFSPNKSEPFIWAVGPVILIPTATNDFLGSEKLGLGPTALALKQQGPWTYGMLMNHIWSVAGSDNRAEVNSTFLQPFLSYTTRDAWTYSINTESTYDWTGNHWAIPIHPGVAKLVRFGKQPISFTGALRCWATSPPGGPRGCGIRFVVTPLFPKK